MRPLRNALTETAPVIVTRIAEVCRSRLIYFLNGSRTFVSLRGSSALLETRFINDLSVPSGGGSLLSVHDIDWASSTTL
jgi:hypothetical protein